MREHRCQGELVDSERGRCLLAHVGVEDALQLFSLLSSGETAEREDLLGCSASALGRANCCVGPSDLLFLLTEGIHIVNKGDRLGEFKSVIH